MLIQWKSVLTKRQTVSLSTVFLNQFGISRGIKLRSLTLLEKAGLIQLSKASGKSLKITLFPYPTKQNSMDPYHRRLITEPQYLFFLPPLIDFTHVRPILTLDNIDPKSHSWDTWIQLVPRPNWLRNVSDDVGGAVTVLVV